MVCSAPNCYCFINRVNVQKFIFETSRRNPYLRIIMSIVNVNRRNRTVFLLSMPLTPSSSFSRNLWRLTERNKKRKNENLANSHSNSNEAVIDVPRRQQQLQRSAEVSFEADGVPPPKEFVCLHCLY